MNILREALHNEGITALADPSAKVHIGSLSEQSGLFSCWKACGHRVPSLQDALSHSGEVVLNSVCARGEFRRPWCGQCEATGSLTVLFGLLS